MSIDPQIQSQIIERLSDIERERNVRILFAVESGSRAWGFPSPDSDYDVRFVYVHPLDWYLSIGERRDVIELPIDELLDINGWELRKALRLLIKPNPVLLEWLRSPIVYRADQSAFTELTALGERVAHLRPSRFHYLRLAESQYRRFIAGRATVPVKKYMYVVRPVLALMWLRLFPGEPVPMDLVGLRRALDLPRQLSTALDEIIRRKAVTREMGMGPRIAAIDQLIESEIAAAGNDRNLLEAKRSDLLGAADNLFRTLVKAAPGKGPADP